MAAMGIYDQIKSLFQDVIAPEIHGLRGDIHRLDTKIDGVDARLTAKIEALDVKTTSMKAELLAEIRRVDVRIDSVHSRLGSLERDIHMAIDIRERLAALEARRD